MKNNKKFYLIFIAILLSFVLGRDIGREEYEKIRIENASLVTQLEEKKFETQGFDNLSNDMKRQLSNNYFSLVQETYIAGENNSIKPGVYNIGLLDRKQMVELYINENKYTFCDKTEFAKCELNLDEIKNIEINNSDILVIKFGSLKFEKLDI